MRYQQDIIGSRCLQWPEYLQYWLGCSGWNRFQGRWRRTKGPESQYGLSVAVQMGAFPITHRIVNVMVKMFDVAQCFEHGSCRIALHFLFWFSTDILKVVQNVTIGAYMTICRAIIDCPVFECHVHLYHRSHISFHEVAFAQRGVFFPFVYKCCLLR